MLVDVFQNFQVQFALNRIFPAVGYCGLLPGLVESNGNGLDIVLPVWMRNTDLLNRAGELNIDALDLLVRGYHQLPVLDFAGTRTAQSKRTRTDSFKHQSNASLARFGKQKLRLKLRNLLDDEAELSKRWHCVDVGHRYLIARTLRAASVDILQNEDRNDPFLQAVASVIECFGTFSGTIKVAPIPR